MTPENSGTLYGVGLGPGDPELMTLKAVRILREAPVIAHFRKKGRAGHARTIAQAHICAAAAVQQPDIPVMPGTTVTGCIDRMRSYMCRNDP